MGASNLTRRPTRREACAIRREIAEGIDSIRAALEDDSFCDEEVEDDFLELPRDDPYPELFDDEGYEEEDW